MLDLLSDSGLTRSKPTHSPMKQNDTLTLADGPLLVYLTITRPDISYAIHILSQFLQAPHQQYLNVAYRVLRYLKGRPGLGLLLRSDSSLHLTIYCDSDWANCPITRCSVTGYFVQLGASPVS